MNVRALLGSLMLGAMVAAGCTSATTPAAATPPKAKFGDSLSLAVSFGSPLTAGDPSVTAKFTLKNNGSASFDGCFGPAWGLSVIVRDGHEAGYLVRADYPRCEEKLTLLPRQEIVWSKKVPLKKLSAGPAKVTGWVRIVDPATCKPQSSCRDVSVASPLMTVSVAEK